MIEYVLILAFVCVGAAAIITIVGAGINTICSVTSKHLSNAKTVATS